MKRMRHALCICALLAVSIAVLLFLNVFTADADKTANYIEFASYSVQGADGSSTELTPDEFHALTPGEQTFVFTAVITEDNYDDYILVTPTGMELTVLLGDTEVYRSHSMLPEEVIDQITARVPIRGLELPLTVTMECRHLGGANAVFPPVVLTTSDMTEMRPNLSWGHRGGIPAGAFAVIFMILAALFLYSIMEENPQFSLIALLIAAFVLMVRSISLESGYLFLPEWANRLFTRRELLWLLLAAFLVYFAANIRRIQLFGWSALASVVVFGGTYWISHATDGAFATAVNEFIGSWIEYGEYTRPMYWISVWLQMVCAAVAGITTVRSISGHIAREQTLALKAELAMENYRVIEEQSRHDAEQRHEFKNHISALRLMLEQGKADDAEKYLAQLEERSRTVMKYTENVAINAILQNASARAKELGFLLEAYAKVDENLSIPESDLCGLLFNMLDNAIEAVEQIKDPQKRRIILRINQRETALGIYCANSYAAAPVFDHSGKLRSGKTERGHGLGASQMERIAEKYHGRLDFSYSEDTFIAQTVLFLPCVGK